MHVVTAERDDYYFCDSDFFADAKQRPLARQTAQDGQGGYDIAKSWDTLGDDRFVSGGDTAAMYSPENELLYDAIAVFRRGPLRRVGAAG